MKLDKVIKVEEDPPLSSAYIRSLVKQLITSKPKDTMNNTNDPCSVVDFNASQSPNLRKHGKVLGARQAQQPTQQHKKQVRRRLNTTRPYQGKLLNMAEARREIVTALKFHRAAMKQANEEQQQHQQQLQLQESLVSLHPSHHSNFEQDGRFKSRKNPRIYPSCTTNFSSDFSSSSFSITSPSVQNSQTWPVSSPFTPPLVAENPNFILPNQTLGLNLNFHDFSNLDATLFLNNSLLYSHSSSPPLSAVTDQEVPSIGSSHGEGVSSLVDKIGSSATTLQVTGGSHTAMDYEGMAEIRSLGELYQMEWNDTMNLATSASWFNFLKNMEHDAPQVKTEDDAHHVCDELIEFPTWLNAKESCLEHCSEDYFQDPNLPWFNSIRQDTRIACF